MKNFVVILLALFTLNAVSAQNLKPYILGAETTESITDVKVLLAEQLEMNGLHLIGQYQPAADSSRWVMIFSSDELISAVQKAGDLTGFAAALRIGITEENGKEKKEEGERVKNEERSFSSSGTFNISH